MKKHFLFLAGSVLLLASSCGSNNNNQQQQTQAQIDSTVNASLAQHDAANAAKNDSTLKAMEAEKAATMSKEHEIRHEEHRANNNNNNNAAAPATPAPTTPAPATNTRTNNAGPQSVNDRPGAH